MYNFDYLFKGTFSLNNDRMSYIERIANLIIYAVAGYYYHEWLIVPKITNVFRSKFESDFIDLGEKMSQSSFAFINSDELVDFPRPISHRIVYVGGIGVASVKPLNGVRIF